jgi:recombination protein RecR
MDSGDPLGNLAACLGRLPGIGSKTSDRMALRLARQPNGLLRDLIGALQAVQAGVRTCDRCGHVTSVDVNPCRLCTDPNRDDGLLCVVEDPSDIMAIERSGEFRGRYHALMGKISPMRGEGPGQLRIEALVNRVRGESFREVILAMNTDVESDATAAYLRDVLQGGGVSVTRLAYGLPVGSGVAYSDAVTLSRAIRGRRPIE